MIKLVCLIVLPLVISSAVCCQDTRFNVKSNLQYCVQQASKTIALSHDYTQMPIVIDSGKTAWKYMGIRDWRSGFWPGILWYIFEYTQADEWRIKADSFTRALTPLAFSKANDHDLGFQMYCSFGNGYRLTKDTSYKNILLATADTLATLFNPKVGTILSWPGKVKEGWPHNTIIDNMMNLELLFWASKNGGDKRLYDIAVAHANTTMKNHFRNDYSAYHVMLYDTVTGAKIKGITHQGYADSSMWARGQAWAIYGFTMCYRETKDEVYLDFAQHVADIFLKRLPKDNIPYWDFDAPGAPGIPKDASAAAVASSALLELSTLVQDKSKASSYKKKAVKMLEALSTKKYHAANASPAFLLHSTGHKPAGKEVDASLNYADYYYLEALIRLKKLNEGIALN